jgi:hypothetical protein
MDCTLSPQHRSRLLRSGNALRNHRAFLCKACKKSDHSKIHTDLICSVDWIYFTTSCESVGHWKPEKHRWVWQLQKYIGLHKAKMLRKAIAAITFQREEAGCLRPRLAIFWNWSTWLVLYKSDNVCWIFTLPWSHCNKSHFQIDFHAVNIVR